MSIPAALLESTLNNLLKSPQIHCYFKVIVQVAGGPSVVIILANILGSFRSISSRPQYDSENIIWKSLRCPELQIDLYHLYQEKRLICLFKLNQVT